MKNHWTQPSLSRDFALLSVAIFSVLFLMSAWVTFITYGRHTDRITQELKTESNRIEQTLGSEMERAGYLLTALGRQVVMNNMRDMVELAQIFKAYDAKEQIYAVFSWISAEQKLVVSSNRGILDKPVDLSDRDFVKRSLTEPWKMHIGRPIEGRVSGRWVIPVAMGLTDNTGKFMGTLLISLDINKLTEQISTLVKRDGISFAIISKTLIPLTQVSDDSNFLSTNFPAEKLVNIDYVKNASGLLSQGNMFWGMGSFTYYSVSEKYPYIILMGYDNRYQEDSIKNMLSTRLLQMVVIAIFFVLFLIIVRSRMIAPIVEITDAITEVARGNMDAQLPTVGPLEINALAVQVRRVKDYIKENKYVENELRNKMFALKQSRDTLLLDQRSKAEFLAYICQDMRVPMNNVQGFSQVMKDQMYGPIENKKYREYAQDIYSGCSHVISQLDYVLELSRIESHYNVLRESIVDVGAVLNRAIKTVSDRLQAANVVIKTDDFEDGVMLYADEFRLHQMFSNTLITFLDKGLIATTIDIRCQQNFETKKRHVVAFEFLTATKLADDEGFSLSLELVKRLAEMHQGTVLTSASHIIIELASSRLRHNG